MATLCPFESMVIRDARARGQKEVFAVMIMNKRLAGDVAWFMEYISQSAMPCQTSQGKGRASE
jgi:hypothetical protein